MEENYTNYSPTYVYRLQAHSVDFDVNLLYYQRAEIINCI